MVNSNASTDNYYHREMQRKNSYGAFLCYKQYYTDSDSFQVRNKYTKLMYHRIINAVQDNQEILRRKKSHVFISMYAYYILYIQM